MIASHVGDEKAMKNTSDACCVCVELIGESVFVGSNVQSVIAQNMLKRMSKETFSIPCEILFCNRGPKENGK